MEIKVKREKRDKGGKGGKKGNKGKKGKKELTYFGKVIKIKVIGFLN